jgi:hypothetical protein
MRRIASPPTLAQQAGAPDPSQLGHQLHVLYDGAGLTARMDPDIASATRAAAETLTDVTSSSGG